MIIQGGVIHIGDGTVVQEGYIRLEDGKIAEVSSGVYSGADREVLDAKGKIITPQIGKGRLSMRKGGIFAPASSTPTATWGCGRRGWILKGTTATK